MSRVLLVASAALSCVAIAGAVARIQYRGAPAISAGVAGLVVSPGNDAGDASRLLVEPSAMKPRIDPEKVRVRSALEARGRLVVDATSPAPAPMQPILWRPDSGEPNPFGLIPNEWPNRPQLLPGTWDATVVFAGGREQSAAALRAAR